jgi:chromosome segregation ATPase
MEKKLKKERKGPRPVLSEVERDIHKVEMDWKASQRNLEDLKLQSKIHKADIERAKEEFLHTIHRDVDLEHPTKLDTTKVESAKKKLESRVKHATTEISKLEKKIPGLIQEELKHRGRLEQLRGNREAIRSGFHGLPIEKDPRMTNFLREKHRIEKEYDDTKIELNDVVVKVRKEQKRKQGPQTGKNSKKRGTK